MRCLNIVPMIISPPAADSFLDSYDLVVNMPNNVNIKSLGGVALEQALGAKLRELLSGIASLHSWQVERVWPSRRMLGRRT
jgi:hypothetical protein